MEPPKTKEIIYVRTAFVIEYQKNDLDARQMLIEQALTLPRAMCGYECSLSMRDTVEVYQHNPTTEHTIYFENH